MYMKYMRYVYCCRFFSLLLGYQTNRGPICLEPKNLDGSTLAKASSTLELDCLKEYGTRKKQLGSKFSCFFP